MIQEIGARSRSFEVLGLSDEVKYRFRIVSVFADDDNRHGDLSRRFKPDPEYDTDRPPRRSPTITQVTSCFLVSVPFKSGRGNKNASEKPVEFTT